MKVFFIALLILFDKIDCFNLTIMSIINSVRSGANDNVCKAIYRRRNEVEDKTEYKKYTSKRTFKKRVKKKTIQVDEPTIVRGENHNFVITRQIKNSKPTKTIYKIGNRKYIFT